MKSMKKSAAAALSLLLVCSLTVPAFAASSDKEEVIYVMTDASGKVTDMEAVNIFPGGSVTDYGDYSAVKMLNTTDKITVNGNEVSFTSDAPRVYYQGTMQEAALPWNISLRYFLNGTEYTAQELAGKSGALEIRFVITKNEDCGGTFYEDYALQASFTLDTDRCRNIQSSGATVANVGTDKQLTYTSLPGKGIDTVIWADVTDFEMDAVAINGVKLNLNVEIDDAALTEKAGDIASAADTINDGASTLSNGAEQLSDAMGTLNGKVGELYTGVGSLTDGADSLSAGLSGITAQNDQLTGAAYSAYAGLCNSAAATLSAQLQPLGLGEIALTPETYSDVLTGIIAKLNANPQTAAYSAQVSALKGQLDDFGALYQGLVTYTGSVDSVAAGASDLNQGMNALYGSTDVLQSAVAELNDAASSLSSGAAELADGTAEFAGKTANIDVQISDEINAITLPLCGGEGDTVSFVSEQNGAVASVQFVIKTPAIEKEETAISSAEEETPMTFWEKLISLFGLN